jgi:hypothetical protein
MAFGNGNGESGVPPGSTQPIYGGNVQDDPIITPIGGSDHDPIQIEPNPIYDEIDPIFTYRSGEFNLQYQKFLPFVLAYIIYKWC